MDEELLFFNSLFAAVFYISKSIVVYPLFFFFILSPQVMLSKPQVIIDFPQLLQIFYERCA